MKYTLMILLLLALCSISFTCQKTDLSQTTNKIEQVDLSPSPSQSPPNLSKKPSPRKNNQIPSQEFIDHYHKGTNIWAVGKFPEDMPQALEEFRKASEIEPDDITALEWMIKIYTRLEDYKNVAECYREIMRRNPESRAQWGLGYTLVWNLEEYEEGLKQVSQFKAKEKPSDITYIYDKTIARAYEGLKDYPNAIKHYKIWLKGSDMPTAYEYKEVAQKVLELEKLLVKTTNSNVQ